MFKIPSFDLTPGERIGNYRILEKKGRGWEGEVYKVEEVATKVLRALKLFHTSDGSSFQKIAHTAWYFEQVQPTGYFPTYHSWGQWVVGDGQPCVFLAFDFIAGSPMCDLLDRVGFDHESAFFSLAEAVASVHYALYAVGDLRTLENVYVSDAGQLFFVDCDPGSPGSPNRDYRGDCLDLVDIAFLMFEGSPPSRVAKLLWRIERTKEFRYGTLFQLVRDISGMT